MKWWEEKADELLAFMEVLQGEESAEKALYVILRELNERLMLRKLKNFEAAMERYYENKHSSVLNVNVYEETQFT